jgi:hypothetical protein
VGRTFAETTAELAPRFCVELHMPPKNKLHRAFLRHGLKTKCHMRQQKKSGASLILSLKVSLRDHQGFPAHQ